MKSRVLSVSILFFLAIAFGCGKSDPTGDAPPATPTPTGNAVFDKNCLGCHAASIPAPGLKSGPNLAKVGAAHPVDWLAEHVKNPKSHNPSSKMPEFASKLSADEIKSVSDFMAGLK